MSDDPTEVADYVLPPEWASAPPTWARVRPRVPLVGADEPPDAAYVAPSAEAADHASPPVWAVVGDVALTATPLGPRDDLDALDDLRRRGRDPLARRPRVVPGSCPCACVTDEQVSQLGPGFSRPVCAVHPPREQPDAGFWQERVGQWRCPCPAPETVDPKCAFHGRATAEGGV